MLDKSLKKNLFISSILLFIISVPLHFAYDFFNNNFVIGLFTPVNESIFEHLKLALFPTFIWWLTFYFFKKDKWFLDKSKWFLGCLISMIVSIMIILSIYYFVKCGIGKEITIINILSLFIALLSGQLLGYHIYKYTNKSNFILSIVIIFFIIFLFVILTIYPPKIPLFKDNQTNTYGIFKTRE